MSPRIKSRLLATQSDERLVLLVRAGHEPAFEALVHRYRKPLLRYCRRLCLSETRAEEVLQQALMNAWVALRRQADVEDVRPWLYRIAHNATINALRKERAAPAEALSRDRPNEEAHAAATPIAGQPSLDEVLALRDALAGMAALPQMQREVMVRTAVGGHSHTEVASALGISAGAVRGLLYRARATLRESMTAITPTPLLAWASGVSGSSTERVAELAAGGGTVGIVGLAAKGAVVAVTAGVAITGAVVVQSGTRHHVRRATALIAKRQIASTRAAVRPASGAEAALPSVAKLRRAPRHAPPLVGRGMRADGLPRPRRITGAKDPSRTVSSSDAPAPRMHREHAALPAADGEVERHRHDISQEDQGHSKTVSQASADGGPNGNGPEGEGEGQPARREDSGEWMHEGRDGGESRQRDASKSAHASSDEEAAHRADAGEAPREGGQQVSEHSSNASSEAAPASSPSPGSESPPGGEG